MAKKKLLTDKKLHLRIIAAVNLKAFRLIVNNIDKKIRLMPVIKIVVVPEVH